MIASRREEQSNRVRLSSYGSQENQICKREEQTLTLEHHSKGKSSLKAELSGLKLKPPLKIKLQENLPYPS
jgi:hypothetical protein